MSPNRIVALLTPLVFAPLAGVICTWAAENLPGVSLDQSSLEQIFIAGALIALAPAAQWLHGWQKHEERQAKELAAAQAGVGLQDIPVAVAAIPAEELIDEDELLADFEDLDELDELDDLEDFDEFEDTALPEDEQPVAAGG
jgi:hypothetical protein